MRKILLAIHIPVALGLLVTGYAPYLDPRTYGMMALAGYAFPVFLILAVLSLAMATLTCKKHLIIPVAALIAAYKPVTLYIPFHSTQEVPEGAITVMSYNTHSWGTSGDGTHPADDGQTVIRYIADSNADIVCLQESYIGGTVKPYLDSILNAAYGHHDMIKGSQDAQVTLYSRFPITRKQRIEYESKGNISAAFWLDINGKEVIVINNHLETTGLSIEERNKFSDMMHGKNDTIHTISRTIFGKLLEATRIRVLQAKAVAAFISEHRHDNGGTPIIVCGDFNDIPHSYVYNTIAKNLTDCYRNTATGPGYSFSHYGMRVRIDNVLCTPDITPYNFKVDHSIAMSDHYPIIGQLLLPQ